MLRASLAPAQACYRLTISVDKYLKYELLLWSPKYEY